MALEELNLAFVLFGVRAGPERSKVAAFTRFGVFPARI
jgi:hypothetical protein